MTSNFNKYTKDGAIPSLMCFYNFYLWRINSILYLTRMKIMKRLIKNTQRFLKIAYPAAEITEETAAISEKSNV